jgi:L-fuconolactonase
VPSLPPTLRPLNVRRGSWSCVSEVRIIEIIDVEIQDPRPIRPLESPQGEDVQLELGCALAREAMASVGVDFALITSRQEVCDYAVARYPDRFVGCVLFDRETDVESWVTDYESAGIPAARFGIVDWRTTAATDDFRTGVLEQFFADAESHRLPVYGMAKDVDDQLTAVAEAHPDLTIIVDHLGVSSPSAMYRNPDSWKELPEMFALANFPNVAVKMSGALSHAPYPDPDLWPHLQASQCLRA